ncbi:hypothetical protein LTR37_009785 [Vermiconidia calcicola]|uniref:Uncharacterized protein n=1 Tax=Vermiconidia calcicola TaxID=1690605 RepID=A0ACC3N6J3_9PEZI|nr:hypothetical protein LTR37_009785 [Vermiconidia calcicola]
MIAAGSDVGNGYFTRIASTGPSTKPRIALQVNDPFNHRRYVTSGSRSLDDEARLAQEISVQHKNAMTNTDTYGSALRKQTTFFGMPAEIRNAIYHMVLVPQYPIELAPVSIPDQTASGTFTAETYHRERYIKQVQPSLALLRTSRQVNREASPIYYGQEFRFTNAQGWHILGHWLRAIGHNNSQLVPHLLVGHPRTPNRNLYERHGLPSPPRQAVKDIMLSPVNTGLPELSYDRSCDDEQLSSNICTWIKISDPTLILLGMRDLCTLKLALFAALGAHKFDEGGLSSHPINKLDFSASTDLVNSVVNIVSAFSDRSQDMTLDNAYAQDPPPLHGVFVMEVDRYRQSARSFFNNARERGWQVEEVMFDNHYTYPVVASSECNNESICQYQYELSLRWWNT